MSVDAASESSERRTRRNWRSWKKHLPLTMDVCFSRHKSGVNVTPRCHAKLEASITSVPSTDRGPPSVSLPRLCLVPVNNSYILSWFNFRRLLTSNYQYHLCTVPIHLSTLPCCEIRNGYRAACRRRKHITSHHAWLPSLLDRPCTIRTIADLRRIHVEQSMSPAVKHYRREGREREGRGS